MSVDCNASYSPHRFLTQYTTLRNRLRVRNFWFFYSAIFLVFQDHFTPALNQIEAINQYYKAHKALDKYSTMHHFGTIYVHTY